MTWLVGNKGMLGTQIEQDLRSKGLSYVGTDVEIDVTRPEAIEAFCQGKAITCIANCAAYTAVDKAEDEPEQARRINTTGVANLANAADKIGAVLLHISTDYVFDGRLSRPYAENDRVNPLSVYGKTKVDGEQYVEHHCERYVILRTAWLYGKHGKNFVYTMLRLFREQDSVSVVSDQLGNPTYTKDLSEALICCIERRPESGVYHYTNEGSASWYDFAVEIYTKGRQLGLIESECRLVPVPSDSYPTKAVRPQNSRLSKSKIKRAVGLKIRNWQDALAEFMSKDLKGA